MTKFTVIGAGLAGLLAGGMLRDECASIVEAQPELPNNHSALLRFKSSVVGDTLNIPFKKVRVMKAVHGSLGNPVADALSYSMKTNGTATLRSSVTANGTIEERYIAPADLIARMRSKVDCPIEFGEPFDFKNVNLRTKPYKHPIISTMPMPVLMKLLGWPNPQEFKSARGFTITAELQGVDVCATLYYPSRNVRQYRASITGNQLIIEYSFPHTDSSKAVCPENIEQVAATVASDFGLWPNQIIGSATLKEQRYAKILPIDEDVRRRFIMWASDEFGIFSLGRFATWRPGLVLDDLVNDVRTIQKIANGSNYEHRK